MFLLKQSGKFMKNCQSQGVNLIVLANVLTNVDILYSYSVEKITAVSFQPAREPPSWTQLAWCVPMCAFFLWGFHRLQQFPKNAFVRNNVTLMYSWFLLGGYGSKNSLHGNVSLLFAMLSEDKLESGKNILVTEKSGKIKT